MSWENKNNFSKQRWQQEGGGIDKKRVKANLHVSPNSLTEQHLHMLENGWGLFGPA